MVGLSDPRYGDWGRITGDSQLSGLGDRIEGGTSTKIKRQRKGQGLRTRFDFGHSDFEVPVGQQSGDAYVRRN